MLQANLKKMTNSSQKSL